MTDLKARAAAIRWPDPNKYGSSRNLGPYYRMDAYHVALAALALCREYIEARDHDEDCPAYIEVDGQTPYACACGRDAILEATRVP